MWGKFKKKKSVLIISRLVPFSKFFLSAPCFPSSLEQEQCNVSKMSQILSLCFQTFTIFSQRSALKKELEKTSDLHLEKQVTRTHYNYYDKIPKSINFKKAVAWSSVLSKSWLFSLIHQLTLFWFQLMYYWKLS